MIPISYDSYQPKIRIESGKELIFDPTRRSWVTLTPEEWVRQNFLHHLVAVMNYPASLIAVEREIRLGELVKRFDIVVFDQNGSPWMIVECKEMNVPLDEKAFEQILRYNITLNVPFLVLTNGSYCRGFKISGPAPEEIAELPSL